MKVTARIISDWDNALSAARFTVGKDTPKGKIPSFDWKMEMCRAEHSPIREVTYRIECHDVPRRAMSHLVRHFMGINKYVHTSRPDRNKNANPDTVNMAFTINAQAVIQISRERLCNTAWYETIEVWKAILSAINDIDPSVIAWCEPRCVLIGACPEPKCCGYIKTHGYKVWRERFLSNFENVAE